MRDASPVSRDVAQLFQPLLLTNRNEDTVLYAQVQARVSRPCFNTLYWCYIIRSNNPSWCPLDQLFVLNIFYRALWTVSLDVSTRKVDQRATFLNIIWKNNKLLFLTRQTNTSQIILFLNISYKICQIHIMSDVWVLFNIFASVYWPKSQYNYCHFTISGECPIL